jgi:hydrogenase maturation factor
MCASYGISLCGGHTEITDAVSRPLVVGTMAGTAPAGRLLDKSKMRPGDRVLLTKGVAVEGTGLIAREFGAQLAEKGLTATEIERAAAFLENIGIIEEARICQGRPGVSALHDVTEGGLATAVSELGTAGGYRLRINMEMIPIYPETRRMCEAMGVDPLGLIGSGSLLITCDEAGTAALVDALKAGGIPVAEIGVVLGPGEGVEARQDGILVQWPFFDRDEVSRLPR